MIRMPWPDVSQGIRASLTCRWGAKVVHSFLRGDTPADFFLELRQ